MMQSLRYATTSRRPRADGRAVALGIIATRTQAPGGESIHGFVYARHDPASVLPFTDSDVGPRIEGMT